MQENKYQCSLNKSRPCPNRLDDNSCIDQEGQCCFREVIEVEEEIIAPKEYVRKPRWYERYYNEDQTRDRTYITRN